MFEKLIKSFAKKKTDDMKEKAVKYVEEKTEELKSNTSLQAGIGIGAAGMFFIPPVTTIAVVSAGAYGAFKLYKEYNK